MKKHCIGRQFWWKSEEDRHWQTTTLDLRPRVGAFTLVSLDRVHFVKSKIKKNKEKCRWQKAILLCSACPVYILSEKKITTTENTCGKKKGWLRLSLLEIWDWSNNFPSLPPLLLIWLLICLNLKPDPPKRGLEGQENPWRGQMIKRTGSSTYRKYQSSQLKIEKKLTIQRGKEAQMKEMVLVKQRSIWALDWIMSFKCNSKFHQIIFNLGWYLILIHQYLICVSLVMFRLPNVPLKMMKKCF